jgi:hypothetical protein
MAAAGSGLTYAGAVVIAPPTEGTPQEVFEKLAQQFKLDNLITTYFVDTLKLANLSDFLHLFSSEAEVAEIVTSKVTNLANRPLMTARIRQAWAGVKGALAQADIVKKRGSEAEDYDALLPQPDLDDLVRQFWSRYHIRYAPSVEPSDLLISRLSKEMDKRLLTIRSIWQTRTMNHQLRTDRKRQKITETIDLVEKESEADVQISKTLNMYLDMLFTLCIAYARAGIKALRNEAPETWRTEPTDYVTAPLDLMLRYHHRAQVKVQMIPAGQALAWLQTKDEEERTLWVERYRSSDLTFGQVVKEVFIRREAAWDVPAQIRAQLAESPRTPGGKGGLGGNLKVDSPAAAQICIKFNTGQCKEPCPANRQHSCNHATKGGGVCGMRNHGAKNCRNPKKTA